MAGDCPYNDYRQLVLSIKSNLQLIELKKITPQTLMTFVDEEDWLELARHVVLVHAVQPDRLVNLFEEEFDWSLASTEYNCQFAIKKVLTDNGVIGSNLDSRNRQYKGQLNFRPHIHWSWNQLVQGHSVSKWEDAKIAIFEPLIAFEDTSQGSAALGIAPYDTFTMGSHKLSKDSIVLVPDVIVEVVKQYLVGFQGKIVGYTAKEQEFPLREEVFKVIQRNYPETWHVIDHKSGHKIGSETHITSAGYSEITCVEKRNGDRIVLISKEGRLPVQMRASAIKNAVKSGKYIGIHNHCVTYWLEDEKGDFSQHLTPFKENPTSIIGKTCFAGYKKIRDCIDKLLVLKALEFHDQMHQFSPQTRAGEAGNYILKETIYADMMSILYSDSVDTSHFFTPFELHLMIDLREDQFKKILRNLIQALRGGDKAKAFEFFQKYVNLLRYTLRSMLAAKIELANPESIEKDADLVLDNILQQQERSAIQGNQDFENKWPLGVDAMKLYISIRPYFDDDIKKINGVLKEIGKKILLVNGIQEKAKLLCLENILRMYLKEIRYLKNQQVSTNAWRDRVLSAFSDPILSAKEIINALSEDARIKEYYAKSAGVAEGYTIGRHTSMVLELAQRYRMYFEPQLSKDIKWSKFCRT